MTNPVDIEAILPQTQCRQCGYKDCADYARAIAGGEKHNRCPAGGDAVIYRLSQLLGREVLPLDETCGRHVPPEIAEIDLKRCFGCTLCVAACPTEAIIGAPKHLHMVDADRCNGCCLCQLACPVDCIRMIEVPRAWTEDLAQRSRSNYLRGKARKEERSRLEEERLNSKSQKDKKDFLAALLKRKRNK